jgi:hypothetical protein
MADAIIEGKQGESFAEAEESAQEAEKNNDIENEENAN